MAGVIGMTVARQRLETNKARDELQRLQSENKQMERLMECQNVQIKDLQLKNQQMQLLFHDLQADNSKLKSLRRAQKENRREEREKRKEEGVGEDDDRERKDKKKSKKHKKEKKEKHHKSSKSKRKDKTENESKVLEVVQELEGEESGSNSSDDDKWPRGKITLTFTKNDTTTQVSAYISASQSPGDQQLCFIIA